MTSNPAPGQELDAILAWTRCLLLDLDGPVCDIFAGLPATTVADRLRKLITGQGVGMPEQIVRSPDPIEVFTYSATISADLAAQVEAEMADLELAAAATARPTPYVHEVVTSCCKRCCGLPAQSCWAWACSRSVAVSSGSQLACAGTDLSRDRQSSCSSPPCKGKGFRARRDAAILRLFRDTGMRLTGLKLDDFNLKDRDALVTGKGSRQRHVRFGYDAALAFDRYRRERGERPADRIRRRVGHTAGRLS